MKALRIYHLTTVFWTDVASSVAMEKIADGMLAGVQFLVVELVYSFP